MKMDAAPEIKLSTVDERRSYILNRYHWSTGVESASGWNDHEG